ncbi:glutathionylspermidine synthase family protein [Paenibacillus xerothermodurans]|uniref:Glutathionylspermidine synthase n=1 Tax=Paenibacillus xerothermodurans TaxID=1977292 RepID=A0A2W1NFV3_PAEXE|nr:glutathionylspermidine synthase family protein [Paenibacillus xerothermodurans]PZE22874.1 glutathionylspermidine synthase [Paenibacillus xerothermodurans]
MCYAERREAIYGPLRREGVFTWDCMYGEEYALAGLHRMDRELHHRMLQAAEGLTGIYARTVRILRDADEALLAELGLPRESFGAVRVGFDSLLPTVIGRFDFSVRGGEIKMLEFNSDTPTGIVEAFHVNGRVCDAYNVDDPNSGCTDMIGAAFSKAINTYRQAGYSVESVHFSALDWHEEDAGTTRYLLQHSGVSGAVFTPLSQLRVHGERLWAMNEAESLRPVELLYRLHALEKLAEDHDDDGYPTGEHVLRLVSEHKLALINPPSGFLAQTKALQALIWNLHETGQFYSEEEHGIIERHMLPTYLENRFSAGANSSAYVVKPIFGREGSGVTIYNADGTTLDQSSEHEYIEQPMIYQRYTELPAVEVETLKGPVNGRLLWGCFVIGGRPSAVIPRVGGHITSNLSYYLPVGFA